MNISIQIEKTSAQCTERIITLNIPGIATDIWLCILIRVKILWISKTVKWAIHLI